LILKVRKADPQTYLPASRGSIRAPRPQRPAPVDIFLQATQGQAADLFQGWPESTGYQSMNDATGTDGSGAYFGVNSQLPKLWTSTSITSPVPGTPPTHSVASWELSQSRTTSTAPIDLSEPFIPGFTPARWATQISTPPPNMPSASPRVSLFGPPSISTLSADDDSHYGAMPESEWNPSHIQAEAIQSLPIATTHAELAQRFCESDPHTTFSPPPTYASIFTGRTESVISPIDLSAPPRYSSRDSYHRSSAVAGSHCSSRFAGQGSISGFRPRYAELSQPAVFHNYIEDSSDDDPYLEVSHLGSRNRSTQNKPSRWDRITTGASRACRSIFRRGPTHAWSQYL